MVHKSFILLVIGVSVLEVNSWPRREFGGFGGFTFGDTSDAEQNDNKNDKAVEENNSEGHGRSHHRQGFGIPFADPATIRENFHALRENFQKLPALPAVFLGKNGILQNFFSSGSSSTITSTSTSTSTSTNTSTTTSSSTSTSPSTSTSTSSSTTSTTRKPEDTSTNAKTSTSTTSSTTNKSEEENKGTEMSDKSSSEQPLPAEFTFMLPTELSKKSEDSKNEKPGKSSPEKLNNEKDPSPGPTRRLINAPLRCQEDSAGNCREAF